MPRDKIPSRHSAGDRGPTPQPIRCAEFVRGRGEMPTGHASIEDRAVAPVPAIARDWPGRAVFPK